MNDFHLCHGCHTYVQGGVLHTCTGSRPAYRSPEAAHYRAVLERIATLVREALHVPEEEAAETHIAEMDALIRRVEARQADEERG